MSCNILLQTGGKLQLQSGGFLLLENCVVNPELVLLGGKAVFGQYPGIQGYSYVTNYQKYIAELEKTKSEIVEKEEIVKNVQSLELSESTGYYDTVVGFDASKADAEFYSAVARAQEEIRDLIARKDRLIRLIDEEESILVLLLSQPFVT